MEEWLAKFLTVLVECGLPERQAGKYLPGEIYHQDAREHFENGLTPEEAAAFEIFSP